MFHSVSYSESLIRVPDSSKRPIESEGKQYKRHAGGSRYPVTFKARPYWFGLDSGLLDSGPGPE
jgi:hypothetical protein